MSNYWSLFNDLGQYYLTCIFLVAVSIVLTTCILSVHYFGDQYFIKPLPRPIKRIFFEVLAPMVGMQCLKSCSTLVTSNLVPSKSLRRPAQNKSSALNTWSKNKQRKGNERSPRAPVASKVLNNSKATHNNHVDGFLQLKPTSFLKTNNFATTRSNPYTSSPGKRSGSLTGGGCLLPTNNVSKPAVITSYFNYSAAALYHQSDGANEDSGVKESITQTSFLLLPQTVEQSFSTGGSCSDQLNIVSNNMCRQDAASVGSEDSDDSDNTAMDDSTFGANNTTSTRADVLNAAAHNVAYSGLVASFDDLKKSLTKIEHYLYTVSKVWTTLCWHIQYQQVEYQQLLMPERALVSVALIAVDVKILNRRNIPNYKKKLLLLTWETKKNPNISIFKTTKSRKKNPLIVKPTPKIWEDQLFKYWNDWK